MKNSFNNVFLLSFVMLQMNFVCSKEPKNRASEEGSYAMKLKTVSRSISDRNELYEGDIKGYIKRMKDEGHKPNR